MLASFRSEARGIKFYDVLTSEVCVGQSLHFQCACFGREFAAMLHDHVTLNYYKSTCDL